MPLKCRYLKLSNGLELYSKKVIQPQSILCKKLLLCFFYFSRHLRDFVSWLSSEPMWIYYIDCFKNSMWPKGKLAPYPPPRTDLVIFIFQYFKPLTNFKFIHRFCP